MFHPYAILFLCLNLLVFSQLDAHTSVVDSIPPKKVFTFVKEKPSFQGGEEALNQYIENQLQYPNEAGRNEVEGTVYVKFKVLPDGSLKHIHIMKGLPNGGYGIDAEALRIVQSMPKWIAGKENGNAVTVVHTLPIQFKLTYYQPSSLPRNNELANESNPAELDIPLKDKESMNELVPSKPDTLGRMTADEILVYNLVDEMPEFKGGQFKMLKFIGKNIKLPSGAILEGTGGTAYVGFVVMQDGSIDYVEIKKGVPNCKFCDIEALRVIRLMPKWNPGKKDGKPVKVAFTLPIRFSLE